MLLEQKTTDFLEQLSSSAPIPGGGGASAAVGAFASALGLMVTNLTVGKKKYADVEEEILEIREKLEQKKQDLVRMVDEDAEAFEPLAKAYRMPKETEEEQAEKEKVMEAALKNAAEAPLCIMKTIVDTMEHYKIHIILSDYTNKRITKEDAKKMLLDCDIGDYKKFLPHIASVIDEIFKESKGVSAKTVSKKKEAEQVGECDNTNSE